LTTYHAESPELSIDYDSVEPGFILSTICCIHTVGINSHIKKKMVVVLHWSNLRLADGILIQVTTELVRL